MVVTSYLSTSVNVVFTHTDFHLCSSIIHQDLMIIVVNCYLMDGDNVDGGDDGDDGDDGWCR